MAQRHGRGVAQLFSLGSIRTMKYLISIAVSLGLFLVFRPSYHYTLTTWLYLLVIYSPIPGLFYFTEKKRKITIHPMVCFLCTWIGGLILGYLVGPFIIPYFRH